MSEKPMAFRPALYHYYYEWLKEIALRYGYNLLLHGSMNRDLDLVAIPWIENVGDKDEMIKEFCDALAGHLLDCSGGGYKSVTWHGRMHYVINLNRRSTIVRKDKEYHDPQYYIDISVMPTKELPAIG
jgi:hypothetical protein